jgi:hypothetical protein
LLQQGLGLPRPKTLSACGRTAEKHSALALVFREPGGALELGSSFASPPELLEQVATRGR